MIKTFTIVFASACLSFVSYGQAIPPLTSTVSGTVWQESKPADGLRGASEPKVAGILVKLLDASTQEVISSTLSNGNGEFTLKANAGTYVIEYVYPLDGFTVAAQRVGADNTINSAADDTNFSAEFTIGDNESVADFGLGLVPQANTITYCTQKESVVTEWTETLLLPKSTVAPVPLNVKLFAAESVYHPMIGVENTGTANAYSITTAGKITMTMPINPASLIMNSDVSIDGELDGFDGQEDYSGASGATFYNRYSFASAYPARNTSSASIIANNFVGTENETFSIPTKAQSTVSFTGAGNLKTAVQTFVSAGACVVYTYAEGALPVKLASFKATKEGKVVNLNWSTTEEIGSDRFEVQRSMDGKAWSLIGEVQANGTTRNLNLYHFTDVHPAQGQNLYRLKMIDQDNSFAFSSIKEAIFKSELSVFPNPAIAQIQVASEDNAAVLKVSIFSQSGQLVKEVTKDSVIDVSALSNGIYTVHALYSNGASKGTSVLVAH